MREFLRAWIVWESTKSPLRLGIVSASLALPMLFMPFVGGFLADKLDRRLVLKFTETALIFLWGIVAALVYFQQIQWWHFIVSGLVSGVIQSIGRPGHQAILGNIVSQSYMPSAIALDTAADTWPRAAGPAIGGILMGIIGVRLTFLLHVFGQIFTAITIFLLRWDTSEERLKRIRNDFRGSFFDGFSHVWNERILFGLIGLGICYAMVGSSVHFLMPVFADAILNVGATGLGFLMTSSTIGASLGSLAVISLVNFPRRGYLLFAVACINAAFLFGFSRSETFSLSICIIIGMGMVNVLFRAFRVTLMQVLTPNHLKGRVISFQTAIQGMSWIGVLFMGSIAEILSTQTGISFGPLKLGGNISSGAADTVLIGAILYGVTTILFFWLVPSLRRFK
jgi:MFS family permease